MASKSLNDDEAENKTVTSAGLLCTAASQPLVTSLAVVWIPIIVFTVITGSDWMLRGNSIIL